MESKMKTKTALFAAGLFVLSALAAVAQPAVRLPEASPAAEAGQTIGVTDVTIRYHRPAVNKRRIWDGQVPYGVVWRAGANENTTIAFSTPMKLEGREVPAGTYALYMIPSASPWTLILSRFVGDWGAYNYDPAEDVLRVPLTPRPSPESQERLVYTFDDLAADSATLSLRWEKLVVPIRIQVDVPATVRASIQAELRGGKHWSSDAWAAAARWELRNGDLDAALRCADHALATGTSFTALRTKAAVLEKKGDAKGAAELRGGKHWSSDAWAAAARWELRNGDLDAALRCADHALATGTSFTALRTKAAVLEKKGDAKGAAELRARAHSVANEAELLNVTIPPMLGEKKYDEAIAWLDGYAAQHPGSPELWRVHAFLGDAYSGKKDRERARAEYEKAMAGTHDNSERTEVQDSINAVRAEGE
jgi:tetratricopeptide (TPR) repeat protein